jgi:POT family proton-dependent oligopeptide transporter
MSSKPEPGFDAVRSDRSFFGHPRGLATLFFTEMWERFSYYGMRALLMLYMTHLVVQGGLGFPIPKAAAIYGLYTSTVYLMCLGGGWLADRITGQRKAVLIGGLFITAGEFCLMAPAEGLFYLGLILLMFGTGLLKGNVSTIVGQLYPADDPRRNSGFSLFYMGINLGAFFAPFLCGWVGEKISWRLGFGLAGIGMLAGVIQFALGGKHLGNAGLHPSSTGDAEKDRRQKRNAAIAVAAFVGGFALLAAMGPLGVIQFTPEAISDAVGWALLAISVVVFTWLIFLGDWTPQERKRSVAVLVLFVSSALFWASFEQAGSSLNIFADINTDRNWGGFLVPASWFQFVQPIFVIIFAPVFAWIWWVMSKKKIEPSSPAKFSIGLLFAGLAFAMLIPAARITLTGAKVGMWWLVGTYFLQTIGELNLSPVGLSAMSKLAPDRAAGFMMGIWFLSTSIGNWMSGKAATFYTAMPLPTLFAWVAIPSIGAAVVLALLVKPTVRLMQGVK